MSTDPHPYIVLIATLASVGALISTLEWLANRRQLQSDGLFSWDVVGCRPIAVGQGAVKRTIGRLLSCRAFLVVLGLRALALLFLPFAIARGVGAVVLLGVVVAASLLVNLRSPFGMDGSDQMATQVFGALFLGYLSGSRLGLQASLWFIAAQTCLAYFTSGAAKALSEQWRGGSVVFGIFNTRTYGYEPAARFFYQYPRVTRLATYGAVTMECAFPLVLVVGWPTCLLFVAWGVSFHLVNALFMGLNSFFWSFVATYPAVVYGASVIEHLIY